MERNVRYMKIEKDKRMTVWLDRDEFSSLMFLTGWGGLYYVAHNSEIEPYLKNFMSKYDLDVFRKEQPEYVKFQRIK